MLKVLVAFVRAILRLLFGAPSPPPSPQPQPEPDSNAPPEIHPPWITQGQPFQAMDKIVLDFRYQERGCASSGLVAYGVRDPEGDRFKLAVRIVDTIAQENEAIFVKVGAEYGRIDGVYTEDRLMVWFPGWNRDIPPYPFGLQCDPISQPEPIMPSINIIPLVLMVEARDERGAVSKFELPMRRMGNPCRGR